MTKAYASIGDYLHHIAHTSSQDLGWPSACLTRANRKSGDIRISSIEANTLALTLTGTAAHRLDLGWLQSNAATWPGDVLLLAAGSQVRCTWKTIGKVEDLVVLQVNHDFFERYCPEIVTPALRRGMLQSANYAPRPELLVPLKLLLRELDAGSSRGLLFAQSVMRLLGLELAHAHWTTSPSRATEKLNRDPRIKRAIDMIEARFREDLSLFDLTQATGLSPGYLVSLFKAVTGLTPHAYLTQRRAQHAIQLLSHTKVPLAEIALDCGFADQSHMTKLFRRQGLATPASYRVVLRQSPENNQP